VTITINGERQLSGTVMFPTDGTTSEVQVRICPPRSKDDRRIDDKTEATSGNARAGLTAP
jgi:hypothetical protein